MSRRGRYVIDTMKVWATKWNLKMPVPPYDDVNYWEGVYRTTKINTDPPFEWGNLTCHDLLTHTYQSIPLHTILPSFSTLSLPQTLSSSSSSSASSPSLFPQVKPIQVRRKNHPTTKGKNTPTKLHLQPQSQTEQPSPTTTIAPQPILHNTNISDTPTTSTTGTTTTSATTNPTIITTTLGELLGNIYPKNTSTTDHHHNNNNNNTSNTNQNDTNNDESILILGCGTSQFGADLLQYQWRGPIIQLDCSSRLIDAMNHHPIYQDYILHGQMITLHDDATVLSAIQDNTIPTVFDKGLIDAFFCTDNDTYLINTLSSVHRVLKPNGGTFCTLSLSHPQFVLPKLLPSLFLGRTSPSSSSSSSMTSSSSSSSSGQPSPLSMMAAHNHHNHNNTAGPSRSMIQQRQQQIHRLWSHIEVRLIMDYMYCYRFTKK